jgi:hypothetical protein
MSRQAENSLASPMGGGEAAAEWALARVIAVRDDPAARLALVVSTYHGPEGRAPRHLPFRRAALSFMRWQPTEAFSIRSTPHLRGAGGGAR